MKSLATQIIDSMHAEGRDPWTIIGRLEYALITIERDAEAGQLDSKQLLADLASFAESTLQPAKP